ncbi:MAG TPA: hypothetical protein VJC18_00575, partial [bacterium]|nr:hypothetical protein [bacterium]
LTVTTEQQLRTDTEPYPWEVFWVFFNYDSEDHQNIRTNYFIFKTNGIELGRFESPDQQTFLATDDEPLVVVGTPNEWVLEKTGQLLSITIDGVLVMTYNGGVENEALFDHAGSIGLYTEDAQAHVTAIEIQPH